MSTLFESVPNGTLGIQIQKVRMWTESIESFLKVGSMDSKSFFGFAQRNRKSIFGFEIRSNTDLDFDQRKVPAVEVSLHKTHHVAKLWG